MSNNCLGIFIKKDLRTFMIPLFIILSLLSGGSIIFSIQKLNGSFRVDNIYAMYAYLSRIFIMFFPVILWGTEFSNRTINMIKISNKDMTVIYFVKFICYMIPVIILAVIAYAQVWIYGMAYNVLITPDNLVVKLVIAYVLYGFFFYGLASLVCMIVKSTTKALIAVFLINFLSSVLCKMLAQMEGMVQKVLRLIPFSYAENAFSFADFNKGQIMNIVIIGLILNAAGCLLLRKRGVV